jgi:hypothetical protein
MWKLIVEKLAEREGSGCFWGKGKEIVTCFNQMHGIICLFD